MQDFRPIWYTIPEFSKESPVSVYHKENEPMDGNARGKKKSVRNLHVLARTGIEWDKRARVGLRITSWRYQVCQAYSGDVTGYPVPGGLRQPQMGCGMESSGIR